MLGCTVVLAPASTRNSLPYPCSSTQVFVQTLALGIKGPASPNQDSSFPGGNFNNCAWAHCSIFSSLHRIVLACFPPVANEPWESAQCLCTLYFCIFDNAIFQYTLSLTSHRVSLLEFLCLNSAKMYSHVRAAFKVAPAQLER